MHLCDPCSSEVHSRGAYKKHVIFKSTYQSDDADFWVIQELSSCKKHDNQPIEFFKEREEQDELTAVNYGCS